MRTQFATSFGNFAVEAEDEALTRLYFPDCIPDDFQPENDASPVLAQAEKEIRAFFAGELTRFTVPLKPAGSEFQLAVWQRLLGIDYGETMTYGAIAKELGRPGAARAIGMACRTNPLPLLIPCHRVVGTDGKLTGFSGGGLDVKMRLLCLEADDAGVTGQRKFRF